MNRSLIFIAALSLVACSNESEKAASGGTPESTEDASVAARSSTSDDVELSELAQKGKLPFMRCQSCHTLEKGAPDLVGPNLHGIFGAKAGSKEGFVFSEVMKNSEIIWSADTLEPWIERPQNVIPGTKMAFAGVPRPEDRIALIQYLKEVTK